MKIPDKAFDQNVAILGRTGSGKSFAARGAVERLLDLGERVCIFDPTGVWWGLKSSADGKREGYEVAIFGGDHADIAIAEASAEPLAKIIATQHLPSIVDVSEMGIGERTRFATHFFETLFRLNKKPLTFVLDEADLFAPQRPMPDQTVMFNRVESIARRGRVRGFRMWLITQRAAELHKSVLSQASTLIAMQMLSPQDRDAMGAWIEGQGDRARGKEILAELPRLPRGTGFLWAPGIDFLERVAFPPIKTFDSMRTPERGEAIEPPTKLSHVDVSGLVDALKPLVPEPKTKSGGFNKADLDAEYVRGREEGFDAGVQAGRDQMRERIIADLEVAIVRMRGDKLPPLEPVRPFVPEKPAPARSGTLTPKSLPYQPVEASRAGLTAPQQRIVDAIAWWKAAGVLEPSRHQVAFVAGYTVNGHFNRTVGELKQAGHVTYASAGTIALNSGLETVGSIDGPVTRAALIRKVDAVLKSEPQRRLFGVVTKHSPIARAALADATGYTVNGHFNRTVGELKSLGLIIYPTTGLVALSSMFEGIS